MKFLRREPESAHWGLSRLGARLPPLGSGSSHNRPFASPRENQGLLDCCAAEAVIAALELCQTQRRVLSGMSIAEAQAAHVDLSVLAAYYLARELMSPPETGWDNGTYLSCVLEAIRRFGVCTEAAWPFDRSRVFASPPWGVMLEAHKHRISAWARMDSRGTRRVDDAVRCLRAGHPIVYGTLVGQAWQDYQAGEVLRSLDGESLGGHATVLVDWDDERGLFLGQNSWGRDWGDDGFYLLDPDVIASEDSSELSVLVGDYGEVA